MGQPKVFFDNILQHEDSDDYEKFKVRLIKQFADKRPFAITLSDFTNCMQGRDERVKDFSVRLRRLAYRSLNNGGEQEKGISNEFRQKLLLSQFVNGVREDIRSQLLVTNPQSWEEAIETASRVQYGKRGLTSEIHAVQGNGEAAEISKLLQSATASYNEILNKMGE